MVEQLNIVARLWWDWSAAMFWQVGLLIVLIAAIDRLIRRWAWPQLRYALWSLVLIKLILPPSLSLPSGIVPGLQPVVKQAIDRLNTEEPAAGGSPILLSLNEDTFRTPTVERTATVPLVASRGTVKAEGLGDGLRGEGVPPLHSVGDRKARMASPQANHRQASLDDATQPGLLMRMAWQAYAMIAWLTGTIALGLWLLVRLHSLAGRQAYQAAAASLPQSFYNQLAGCAKHLGLSRVPRVVVSRRLASPAVFGVLRPVLLMPKGYLSKLSRRDTEHMLLHELAHIKRGDLMTHGLYMLLQIVYWYNPLLWLMRRQMHHLRELSCDATVAELLRERTPAYRQTLLETARRLLTASVEPGLGLLGLFEDSNRLLVRLNWLTKPTWRYRTMKRVTVATIAALMLACVLPMAQAREAASDEVRPVTTEEETELSQQMAELQARLEQLQAQQEELQNEFRALAERRRELSSQRRSPQLPAGGGGRPGGREEIARARAEQPRAEAEGRRAAADQAAAAARRAIDEARRQVAQTRQHERMMSDQLREWQQGEQMQQWRRDMERWGQQMQEWAHAQAQWPGRGTGRTHGEESPAPAPTPAMPPMPAPPQFPVPENAPAAPSHHDAGDTDMMYGQETDGMYGEGTEGMMYGRRIPHPPALPAPAQVTKPEVPGHAPEVHVPHVPPPHIEIPDIEPPVLPATPEHDENLVKAVHYSGFGPIPGDRLLDVVNHVGSITVRGGDGSEYMVRAVITARAETKERAHAIAEQLVTITDTHLQADGRERIIVSKPEGLEEREGCEVVIEVTAPRNARLKLRQDVGDIHLAGLRGSVEASDRVGSIWAVGVSGQVALNVDVGGIDFAAPKDLSARVQAQASLGDIRSALPLELAKARGPSMGSSASGTIGQGVDNISLNTRIGSIRIRTQAGESDRRAF